MPELTPLDGIAGFDEPLRKKLADYWIGSAEEFHSVVRSSNQQYGSGRKALAAALGVDESVVKALADTVRNTLPADTPFSIAVDIEVGAGLIMDDVPEVEASSFAAVVDLPEAVEPLTRAKGIPAPQSQGKRNACVAFSLAAIYQVLSGDPTDLSEQFLYAICKEKDGIRGDVGTNPLLAVQLLRDVGICTERTWPYQGEPVDNANPGHGPAPAGALGEAKLRRISGFTQLPATGSAGVGQIKAQLAQGRPVMIGMPIYEHWTGSTQAMLLGRLRAPLPGERKAGGHAMCVVGYRDDAGAPGGGYFIVRNSWGTAWGTDNPDGPGYCHMPYLLVARQNLVALVADGVAAPEVARPAAPGGSRGIPNSGRLGGSAAGGDNLAAIYADLLAIKAQVDGLALRLQGLLGVSAAPAIEDAGAALDASAAAGDPPAVAVAADPPAAPAPVEDGYVAPLVFINKGAGAEGDEQLYPNGIDGVTGRPLLQIDAAAAANMAQGLPPDPPELTNLYKNKAIDASGGHFGTVADADQRKIEQARWAVVVPATEDSAVLKALWPLIQHRMGQMGYGALDVSFKDGENCAAWLGRHSDGMKKTLANAWGEVPPVLVVRPNERVNAWLARHGVSQGPVDPGRGVPFYLLIVGRPGPLNDSDQAFIGLNFQYELDIFWGVGRLIFSDASGQHRLADYTSYAERVVGWEQRSDAPARLRKEIAFFGTRHEEDTSTIRSADELIKPLVDWSKTGKAATDAGIGRTVYLAEDATRSNLEKLLSGGADGKPPALLFTASHGIGLPTTDNRLVMHQGALVTADFGGFGSIKRDHWMAGEDLDAMGGANVEGMIAFLFACYGAGCPKQDEFIFDANKKRPTIAPFPFMAQLPQRLLAKGALGVLGHVERAWTYSFSGTEAGTKSQVQPFQDVLGRLLQGHPAGSATDQFNIIQGARSMTLTEELEAISYGATPDPALLSRLWMARNDARNYALLGDPAVKLAL